MRCTDSLHECTPTSSAHSRTTSGCGIPPSMRPCTADPDASSGRSPCIELDVDRSHVQDARAGPRWIALGEHDAVPRGITARPLPTSRAAGSRVACTDFDVYVDGSRTTSPRRCAGAERSSDAGFEGFELLDGHEHRRGPSSPRDGPTTPLLLEQVHEPTGAGEPDPQLALQHARRAEPAAHHQLHRLGEQVVIVVVVARRRDRRRRALVALQPLDVLRRLRPGGASGRRPCARTPRRPTSPGCAGRATTTRDISSMSPWPMSFSAPGWSRITRESASVLTENASRLGTLALMTPVMTSTDGRCVAITRWMPTARAICAMRQMLCLDVARRDHHQVVELVDHDDDVRQALVGRAAVRDRGSRRSAGRRGRTSRCSRRCRARRPRRAGRSAGPSRARPTRARSPPSSGW